MGGCISWAVALAAQASEETLAQSNTTQDPSPVSEEAQASPCIAQKSDFDRIEHDVDLCVVGGGMAGLCAAISAARHGAKVLLMQDRPVLGGNASSEIRMHVCGAHGADAKETGVLEEIMLENIYRNPGMKYTIWDTVLYEKARFQENLTLLLSCSCLEVNHSNNSIQSITGWQTPSQQFHHVKARYFADCSGDSVLRVCGAEFRAGRESKWEFDESHAPEEGDKKTMGNSILIQLREVDEHVPFIPPKWAHVYTEDNLPNRPLKPTGHNFWWLEVGGELDSIADADAIRDELYKIAFGVWAYIKNHPDGRAKNWEMDWIGAVPGKRENIRYVGDIILDQNDVEAEGPFPDIVAYGGWSMDDHHPAAIEYPGPATIFHPAPSPYGIPYRCLYSKNINNLFFAGRNISATHMALSSTRVMATCSLLGQALGTAAALAVKHNTSPRGVYKDHIAELQQTLMDDDAYLPKRARAMSALTQEATLTASNGDPEPLRNGIDRNLGNTENGWWTAPGGHVEYRFDSAKVVEEVRFIFDNNPEDVKRIPYIRPKGGFDHRLPEHMCADFDVASLNDAGQWETVEEIRGNYQRLVRVAMDRKTLGIRFVPKKAWGEHKVHLLAFDLA
jgi:hypothetical protein